MIQNLYSKKMRFDNFETKSTNIEAFSYFKGLANDIVLHNKKGEVVYLWGETGTGKTHLVSALVNEINENANVNILCTSATEFIHEMSLKLDFNGCMRRVLWQFDMMIIEDIQVLLGREKCINELSNSIDFMVANCKNVVLTSNIAPHISGFNEQLIHRYVREKVIHIEKGEERVDKYRHEETMKTHDKKDYFKRIYKIELDYNNRSTEIYEEIRDKYLDMNTYKNELRRLENAVYTRVFTYPYAAIVSKEGFLKHFKIMLQEAYDWKPTRQYDFFCVQFDKIVDYGRSNDGRLDEYEEDYILDMLWNFACALAKIEISNYEISKKYVEEVRFVLWEKDKK